MDAAHPSLHPGPQPPRVQRPPCTRQAVLELRVGSVFLVHAGPDVVPHGHQWRQEVDLGRRVLLTTADPPRRRSNTDAETTLVVRIPPVCAPGTPVPGPLRAEG